MEEKEDTASRSKDTVYNTLEGYDRSISSEVGTGVIPGTTVISMHVINHVTDPSGGRGLKG
jgi:hypothetical protein